MRNSETSRRRWIEYGAAASLGAPPAFAASQTVRGTYNVRDLGAKGDGVALDTSVIQRAIDAANQAGGGRVYFAPGRYLSGGLTLRSRVTLELENGATLLGSRDLNHYPKQIPVLRSYTDNYVDRALIYAENAEDVAITGMGKIDGQGKSFPGPYLVRPYLIRMVGCRGVSISNITLLDSPMWVQHYLACDEVDIRSIRVHSRANANNDGIDIDGCHRVRISGCEISSGDDAIVLKSTLARLTRDVVITNCVLSSHCNALKLGTETNGGFQNISISNCSIYDTRLSGVTLQIVDGGILDGVTISNITMHRVNNPLFLRLGNRARPFTRDGETPAIGRMHNVTISNIEASGGTRTGCAISGLPGHSIENVTLTNLRLSFEGGGTGEDAERTVPENPDRYPEHHMFGILPAYGLYCRHVRNLRIDGLETRCAAPDARPPLTCDDVEDLDVTRARLETDAPAASVIRLRNVREASIQACRAPREAQSFVEVDERCRAIHLLANEASRAAQLVTGEGASKVAASGNHSRQ